MCSCRSEGLWKCRSEEFCVHVGVKGCGLGRVVGNCSVRRVLGTLKWSICTVVKSGAVQGGVMQ